MKNINYYILSIYLTLFIFLCNVSVVNGADVVAWQPYVLDYDGPTMKESDSGPNPFLDFRFQVFFVGPGGQSYNVPGFFAGNGNGVGNGNVWRVIFTPDKAGTWSYSIFFDEGDDIAVSRTVGGTISVDTTWSAGNGPYVVSSPLTVTDNATLTILDDVKICFMEGAKLSTSGSGKIVTAGSNIQMIPMIPEAKGSFSVAVRDPDAPGFLGKGRLVNDGNDGSYYLRCKGDNTHWIKGGTDSPENFLAYYEFDNTLSSKYCLHKFEAHANDSNASTYKNLFGAINYLALKHVNSIYMLLMNIGGDGQDVYPYSGKIDTAGSELNDNLHFDISKLYQWDELFKYCQEKGIHLHFVLGEGEAANKLELDDATLGTERKLFYREMVARFGYHNALTWNLCEEYDLSEYPIKPDMVKSWAHYIGNLDPFSHPITVHNWSSSGAWQSFFGDENFGALSHQYRNDSFFYAEKIRYFREETATAGWKIPICIDEPHITYWLDMDTCWGSATGPVCGQTAIRKKIIYPIYYSGGQLELILGKTLATENFANYDRVWDYMWYARNSLSEFDVSSMEPHNELVSEGATGRELCFTNGRDYAIYLPGGGSCQVELSAGLFVMKFYNPRTGEYEGDESVIEGDKTVTVVSPSNEDWSVIFSRK